MTFSRILASLALPTVVNAHGALTLPEPRECAEGKCNIEVPWYDPINFNGDGEPESKRQPVNDPSGHYQGESLVCRISNQKHSGKVISVTAGAELDLSWTLEADHPGDGGLFVSYDAEVSNTQDMKFFKIANFPQTRQQNRQTVAVKLPEWLPPGRALLRWDWYATHNYPLIEFYANCVDVNVVSSSKVSPQKIPSYKIEHGTGTQGSYPRYDDEEAWVCGDCEWAEARQQWEQKGMRGPACVGGVEGNCCDLSSYVPTSNTGAGFPICKDVGSSGSAPWLDASTNAPTSSNLSGASAVSTPAGFLLASVATFILFAAVRVA